jgi:transcriptional regulator with XRE-family HTH domain
MNETTNLRRLRLRHGITLGELAAAACFSNQQTSRVELLQRRVTPELEQRFEAALGAIITSRYRAAALLEKDCLAARGSLLRRPEE